MSRRLLPLLAFLLIAVGGGLLIGSVTETAGWYDGLAKPPFTPPPIAFPIAWTILYVLIGVAGWRVWLRGDRSALGLWVLQMALNFAWTPTFFAAHQVLAALGVILALLATILAFLFATARTDRIAFLCFVPYALWVGYASLLNASIWWLN